LTGFRAMPYDASTEVRLARPRGRVVLDGAMSSPDSNEPHDIADTVMFRRFVEDSPQPASGIRNQKWLWVLIAVIVFIVVVVGIALLQR